MQFHDTQINAVKFLRLEPRGDERGSFMRRFCAREFAGAGLPMHFVQCNQSITRKKGTVRGMHYQFAPSLEDKLVGCISGRVFDVAVDLRKGSPTFMQWYGCELDETSMLFIPKGCAHGFQTLTDDVTMTYMHTQFYSAEHEAGLRHDDPAIGISWPLPVSVISERDKSFALLDKSFMGVSI